MSHVRLCAALSGAVASAGSKGTPRARRGFSLVELLIAASLTALLLAGAWGWVWTTAAAARKTDAGAQGLTSQAFAARLLRADLERCVGLGLPEQGTCGPTGVVLVCRDPATGAEEVVTLGWDARRGVLWRKAAGSYLAEGVASCVVRYFARDGGEIVPSGGVLGRAARRDVARLRVEWRQAATRARQARMWVVDAALPVATELAPP